jgi:hypothetical protein
MEDERRRQVERLYHSVLQISPDQRDAFLKRECPEGLGTARPWGIVMKRGCAPWRSASSPQPGPSRNAKTCVTSTRCPPRGHR